MKKYLVPARLNQKYLLLGCTVIEGFLILGAFVLAVVLVQPVLILVPALLFACSCRFIGGEMNGRDLIKMLYQYYAKPQTFGFLTKETQ